MSPPHCLQSLYFLAALCHKKAVQERIEPLLRNITLQNASWAHQFQLDSRDNGQEWSGMEKEMKEQIEK